MTYKYPDCPVYPNLATLGDISAAYNISIHSLHAAMRSGKLKAWRIGVGAYATYACDQGQISAFLQQYKPRRMYRTKARIAAGVTPPREPRGKKQQT